MLFVKAASDKDTIRNLQGQVNELGKENQDLKARVKMLEEAARPVFKYNAFKVQYPRGFGELMDNLYQVVELGHTVWEDRESNEWEKDPDEGDR